MSFMSRIYHFLQFSLPVLYVTRICAISTQSLLKKCVQILGECHFPLGLLVEREAACFSAPGQKASKKPLNGAVNGNPPSKGSEVVRAAASV